MRKLDRKKADAYFKYRTTMIVIYLAIGVLVSYVVVFNAEALSSFTVIGIPFHYYMGAQGAVLTFIVLLFINAIISDKIDKKFGFNPEYVESADNSKVEDQ
ncbi:membrane protein [Halobacillus andaensis]|uniref:Membrane protein n=1 Tax=Halobacillus andaensis TaxID=1176239 RepID=A0A917B837_HALAA|nr:sodium/substrate symporter small subunit [Halobacillus andaensis]MBP2005361.1 putative solute:sodium symporter small subunit [Halobacillus andaensis]GGF30884.1 membrane protein [Halobacillus andaensis]